MADDISRYLSRCAYEGIEFPTTSVTTTWGHDGVEHSALLVDGVDNEPTGRMPLKITCECAFLNSLPRWPANLFPDVWRNFTDTIASTPKGTFTHPTRGNLDVKINTVSEPLPAKGPRNGVYVTLTMTEDNASASVQIGDATGANGAGATDPATDTDNNYSNATTQLTAAGASAPASYVGIQTALDTIGASTLTYLDASRAFGSIQAGIADALALSSIAGASGHDVRAALEALRVAAYRYQDRYLGTATPTIYVVKQTMSLMRVAVLVYGSAAKVSFLRNANQVSDELFVPAGTALVVT